MPAPSAPDPADPLWMRQALLEAELGVGLTSPNPPVGAVIVRDGRLIGAGHHQRAGGPHAEIEALNSARARFPGLLPGATLYVTLEPCSTHGRTPPCTSAIIQSGLARVVYGAGDPNPLHQGRADSLLLQHGIQVTSGILESDCATLIRPFSKWTRTGLPYLIAKAGQSLDGRITRPPGESQWITNDAARAHGRRLRRRVDAILVGAETIRRDNPLLTLRDSPETSPKTQPWRVILSRSGRLPPDARVFTDAFKDRTLVLPAMDFAQVLQELARRQITSVLVEGGGLILGQAFSGGFVDEAHWYLAPRFCGGGRPSLDGPPLARSIPMSHVQILPLGDNVLVSGYPVWDDKEAAP
jgi:diaminohydroxyphosphoribosylaminopyrimidine deaminase / 5-amino-6-(5-phosphoribosylamino)uracil reductase